MSNSTWVLLAQASQKPAEQTVPEPVRYIAYMALLGIALLGMLMIVGTLLGGHWVRRWGDRIRRPSVPDDTMIPRKEQSRVHDVPPDHPNDGDTWSADETIA